jgi:hypothetical protein
LDKIDGGKTKMTTKERLLEYLSQQAMTPMKSSARYIALHFRTMYQIKVSKNTIEKYIKEFSAEGKIKIEGTNRNRTLQYLPPITVDKRIPDNVVVYRNGKQATEEVVDWDTSPDFVADPDYDARLIWELWKKASIALVNNYPKYPRESMQVDAIHDLHHKYQLTMTTIADLIKRIFSEPTTFMWIIRRGAYQLTQRTSKGNLTWATVLAWDTTTGGNADDRTDRNLRNFSGKPNRDESQF